MGVPVVATDVGGVAELVDDGVTGFVVPPLRPEALADAVLRAGDPATRAAMGARARERAAALCATERCAQVHLEAYERALAHRGMRRRSSVVRAEAGESAKTTEDAA